MDIILNYESQVFVITVSTTGSGVNGGCIRVDAIALDADIRDQLIGGRFPFHLSHFT